MPIGRDDYQERREARIERMRHAAAKLAAESGAARARATSLSEMIPLGQPILVGHHSEKRHRRDIERIQSSMSRAVESGQMARALAARADAAEESTAISSDDPEALVKLRANLATVEQQRALGVAVNKAIRAAKGNREQMRANLAKVCLTAGGVSRFMTPDCFGRIGAPAYRLRNLASEAKRIAGRIAQLEAREAAPAKVDEIIGAVTIRESDNRVQMIFPGKPSEEIRARLKSNGFRWSPTAGAWQRMPSDWAWTVAREIAAQANGGAPC